MTAAITIEASLLAKAMRGAAGIVESRNTIPILSHVRLIADGDWLEVTTSDLDIEYRQRVPLSVSGALATTVSASRLKDLASAAAPGAQLSLSMEAQNGAGERLVCKAGRSRWVLPVLPATDFPDLRAENLPDPIEIGAKALNEGLKRVAWAASTEAVRAFLCGVYLDHEAGRMRLVAADGKVAVIAGIAAEWPDDAPNALVPNKAVKVMQSLLGDAEGAVTLAWSDRLFRMQFGDVTLTGKMIEAQFPDYRRFLPEPAEPVTIDPEALRAAIKRVKLVASEKERRVALSCAEDRAVLLMTSFEGGAATEEVAAACAKVLETSFPVDQLDRMAEAIGGDSIELRQTDVHATAILRRVVDDGALGVIVGMK